MNNVDITRARSYYYEFFARAFFYEERDEKFKFWLTQCDVLSQNPLNDASAQAFDELKKLSFEKFKREQNNVLFDFSYVNVPMTASFYEEGRDDGMARIRVIDILKKNLYVKDFLGCEEAEDYIGFIFFAMATFLFEEAGAGGAGEDAASAELFKSVINGFVDEFMDMIEEHEKADLFLNLVVIMRGFFELERNLLNTQAPLRPFGELTPAQKALNRQPYKSKMPTAKPKIAAEEFSLADK